MEVCTLASSSSGNSLLVRSGAYSVLIDAGVSARRITSALRQLGVDPAELSGVLVTHAHTDHTAGLGTLLKQLRLPVYATAPTLDRLGEKLEALAGLELEVTPQVGFYLGPMWVQAFPTPHDCPGSVGYTICCDGAKLALATDLGHVTQPVWQGVQGADMLVAETNHDEEWVRTGPYPYHLKRRILGDYGHLSNEAGADLVGRAVERGTRTVVLAHLSQENNTPAKARETVCVHLRAMGVDPERDLALSVAPKGEPGVVHCLGRTRAPAFAVGGARGAAAW